MGILLDTYIGAKVTKKGVEFGSLGALLVFLLILILPAAGYLVYIFNIATGHTNVPLKKMNEYGLNLEKTLKLKKIAILLAILSASSTFVMLYFDISDKAVFWSFFFSIMVSGMIFSIAARYFYAKDEIVQKNNFVKFLNDYSDLIASKQKIVEQAAATYVRNSSEYINVLNAEVESLMNKIQAEYKLSAVTLGIVKVESQKILDS